VLTALALAYAATGYWYFWQVISLDASAQPSDLALCAFLGLLFGPLLMALAAVAVVLTSDRLTEVLKRQNASGADA